MRRRRCSKAIEEAKERDANTEKSNGRGRVEKEDEKNLNARSPFKSADKNPLFSFEKSSL